MTRPKSGAKKKASVVFRRRQGATLCPQCGATLDAAGSAPADRSGDYRAPAPGDWTICAYCLTPLVVAGDASLRLSTPDEWAALDAEVRGQLEDTQRRLRALPFPRPSQDKVQ